MKQQNNDSFTTCSVTALLPRWTLNKNNTAWTVQYIGGSDVDLCTTEDCEVINEAKHIYESSMSAIVQS